jgi:hypothetical protein
MATQESIESANMVTINQGIGMTVIADLSIVNVHFYAPSGSIELIQCDHPSNRLAC